MHPQLLSRQCGCGGVSASGAIGSVKLFFWSTEGRQCLGLQVVREDFSVTLRAVPSFKKHVFCLITSVRVRAVIMLLVSSSASAILKLWRYVGCNVMWLISPEQFGLIAHSTKTILPCISTRLDRWSSEFCDRKLLDILWLFFKYLEFF